MGYVFGFIIVVAIICVLVFKGSQLEKYPTSYLIGIIIFSAVALFSLWNIMLLYLPGFYELVKSMSK